MADETAAGMDGARVIAVGITAATYAIRIPAAVLSHVIHVLNHVISHAIHVAARNAATATETFVTYNQDAHYSVMCILSATSQNRPCFSKDNLREMRFFVCDSFVPYFLSDDYNSG